MKNITPKQFLKIILIILAAATFSGCGDYFENPMKDKDTGEDINLLVLDFNFFETRLSFKLQDAQTGEQITEAASLTFTGKNGNDIVNYTGEKLGQFETTQGQIELTVDPNVPITETSPLEFAVHVEVPGYNSLSQGIQLRNKGKKTTELQLSKVSDEDETDLNGNINFGDGDTSIVFYIFDTGLKSANADEKPYQVNYSITLADFLKLKDINGDYLFNSSAEVIQAYNYDPENFVTLSINSYSDYSPGTDVVNIDGTPTSVLFQKLETGKLTKLLVTGRLVADLNGGVISSTCTYTGSIVPDIFGFAYFGDDSWEITGTQASYNSLNFSYTLVKASTEPLCETGSSITFKSNVISSFSIDADIYDLDGNLINTVNFKGNFPETFVMENTPNKAVQVVFRDNNPSFEALSALQIDNFCTGSYEVNVTPVSGYSEYQIVLKALCPDNPTVAIAPTYSAEIKIKDSEDPWQGVDMIGGVVDLLGKPGQEYELRLLWQDAWEYSSYYTEFDENGNYLHETDPDAVVTSKELSDGRMQINVKQTFKQNVCDDMGW